MLYKLLKRLFE